MLQCLTREGGGELHRPVLMDLRGPPLGRLLTDESRRWSSCSEQQLVGEGRAGLHGASLVEWA